MSAIHINRPRLPGRPLAAWLGPNGAETIEAVGWDRTALYRWTHCGLTDILADQIACRLGVHPTAIWGDLWWWTAPEPEPEPDGRFCGRNTR
jgi:hypothetical protein